MKGGGRWRRWKGERAREKTRERKKKEAPHAVKIRAAHLCYVGEKCQNEKSEPNMKCLK